MPLIRVLQETLLISRNLRILKKSVISIILLNNVFSIFDSGEMIRCYIEGLRCNKCHHSCCVTNNLL